MDSGTEDDCMFYLKSQGPFNIELNFEDINKADLITIINTIENQTQCDIYHHINNGGISLSVNKNKVVVSFSHCENGMSVEINSSEILEHLKNLLTKKSNNPV